MNEKDRVEHDISLTFDFLRYMVDHPDMIDGIPEDSEVEFVGSDIVIKESGGKSDPKRKQTLIHTKRIFEVPPPSSTSSD